MYFFKIDNMCTPDRHSLVQDLNLSHHVYRVCVSLCLPVYSFSVQVLSVQQPPGQGLH